jgi:hypothetical protein
MLRKMVELIFKGVRPMERPRIRWSSQVLEGVKKKGNNWLNQFLIWANP